MENNNYCWSYDGENFNEFDYDEVKTEEQAIAAAQKIIAETNRNVYIGVAHHVGIDDVLPDLADTVIDIIGNHAYDEYGEYAEDYLSDVSDDAEIELNIELCKVVKKWAKKHKYEPTFFRVGNTKHVVENTNKTAT